MKKLIIYFTIKKSYNIFNFLTKFSGNLALLYVYPIAIRVKDKETSLSKLSYIY